MQKVNDQLYLTCLYLGLTLLFIWLGSDLVLLFGETDHFPKFFPIAEVGIPILLVLIFAYKKLSLKKYLYMSALLLLILAPSLLITRDIIQYYFVLEKEADFVLKEIKNPQKMHYK